MFAWVLATHPFTSLSPFPTSSTLTLQESNKNNRQRCSMKKGFLKYMQHSQESTFVRISLQIRRYSNTEAFLWNNRNFSEHLIYKTRSDDCLSNKDELLFYWQQLGDLWIWSRSLYWIQRLKKGIRVYNCTQKFAILKSVLKQDYDLV